MVRRNLILKGKYVLYDKQKRHYFHAMGIADDGRGPVSYVHWTPYASGAMAFDTIKHARAMRNRLDEEGFEVSVITRTREVVM